LAAQRAFGEMAQGGFQHLKEECRDTRGVALVENFIQDLRYGLRVLCHTPGFAAVAVVSLALGIGVNAAIFSFTDTLLLKPLPVPNRDAIAVISTDPPDLTEGLGGVSYKNYRDFRSQNHSFESLTAYHLLACSVAKSVSETPQLRGGMLVSDNFFQTMRIPTAIGRTLLPEDGEVGGGNAVAVLGYDFWRTEFSAWPSVIGSTLRINGIDFTLVGIAPKDFTGVDPYFRPNFYVPLQMWGRITGA